MQARVGCERDADKLKKDEPRAVIEDNTTLCKYIP